MKDSVEEDKSNSISAPEESAKNEAVDPEKEQLKKELAELK